MWSSSLQVDVFGRLRGDGTSGLSCPQDLMFTHKKKMPLLLLTNTEGRARENFLDLLRKFKNAFLKLTFDRMQFIQVSVPSDFG